MKIHLITNCSNGKSSKLKHKVKVSTYLNTGKCPSKSWLEILSKHESTIPAINAYVGDHWSQVTNIYNKKLPVWVVSAGYGLISADDRICSYNATFNPNEDNSVSRFYSEKSLAENNRLWWRALHLDRHGNSESYEPIEKLYKENKSDVFFFALPPNYLKVIEPELVILAKNGTINKDNTFVFSSKKIISDSLIENFYPVTDDFCQLLGGSRASVCIRLVSHVLGKIDNSEKFKLQVDDAYKDVLISSAPAKRYNRVKLTDEEVLDFIRNELSRLNLKYVSASKLLRILRDNEFACEQKRFHVLYTNFITK